MSSRTCSTIHPCLTRYWIWTGTSNVVILTHPGRRWCFVYLSEPHPDPAPDRNQLGSGFHPQTWPTSLPDPGWCADSAVQWRFQPDPPWKEGRGKSRKGCFVCLRLWLSLRVKEFKAYQRVTVHYETLAQSHSKQNPACTVKFIALDK